MRKNVRILTCLSVAIIAMAGSSAQAAWKIVSRPAAPQKVTVDESSLQKNGMLIDLWAKVTPPPAPLGTIEAANGPSQQNSPDFAEGLPYLIQVSCSDKLIRLSAAAQTSTQPNPFGTADASPYTFQPVNNAVAYSIYSAACNAINSTSTSKPVVAQDDPSLNINPRRTAPSKRNPWPYTTVRGY